jgi:hypothetical protein
VNAFSITSFSELSEPSFSLNKIEDLELLEELSELELDLLELEF